MLVFVKPAFAEQNASLALPNSTVLVGETFALTLKVKNNKQFFAHSFKIEYDSTAVSLQTQENCNVIKDGVARVALTCSSTTSLETELQFVVLTQKNATFKITEITVSDGNEEYYYNDISETFNNVTAVKGDLDQSGTVDVTDLALLKKEVAGISPIKNSALSDYDSNGMVDVTDLALLKKFIAGI